MAPNRRRVEGSVWGVGFGISFGRVLRGRGFFGGLLVVEVSCNRDCFNVAGSEHSRKSLLLSVVMLVVLVVTAVVVVVVVVSVGVVVAAMIQTERMRIQPRLLFPCLLCLYVLRLFDGSTTNIVAAMKRVLQSAGSLHYHSMQDLPEPWNPICPPPKVGATGPIGMAIGVAEKATET